MFELLLGHLVGDYLLQNDWMALNKGQKSFFGWWTCFIHCMVYSLTVCAFTEMSFDWFFIVFNSHFWIDHFSIADKWSKIKGNQGLGDYMASKASWVGWARTDYVTASFKSIVYVVQDNTMHLVLMYWGWIYLMEI